MCTHQSRTVSVDVAISGHRGRKGAVYLRLLRFVLARDAQPFLKHLLESQLLKNYDTDEVDFDDKSKTWTC